MNNNILLEQPKIRIETHTRTTPDFPFIVKQPKDHRKSRVGVHENLELLCFLEGAGFVLYDGVRYPVRKGDIVVVNSYTIHQVVSKTELPIFCLIIDRKFCRYCGIDPVALQFQPLIRGDEGLSGLYQQMMAVYESREDRFFNAAFKNAVLALLLHLCRRYSSPRREEPANPNTLERIHQTLMFMKANYARKITSDDIAASAGLSKFHFQREFKRVTGRTPNHYLNMIRCAQAQHLLETGQHSVKETAILCGFTNFSYFSNVFQQYIGVLPSQVRPTEQASK